MQQITIDISNRSQKLPVIHAKQADIGRKFQIFLTDNGINYFPAAGSRYCIWYAGTDGEGNYTAVGEHSAVSVSGNVLTVELIAQMLTGTGGTMCLTIHDPEGSQLGIWNILYNVESVPGADSPEAEVYYSAFTESVADAIDAAARAEAAASAVTIDPTLSLEGAAADAAAVGEALGQVIGCGLGAGEMTVIDDADDTSIPTGWYHYTSQTPLVSGVLESLNGLLRVERYSDSFTVQTYYFMVTGMEPIRRSFCYDYALDEDIWTPWVSLGAADRVVEQGKSGIWNYRKWDSGRIELWTNEHPFTVSFTSASGLYYATQSNISVPLVKTIQYAGGGVTMWHYVNWSSVTCNDNKLGIRYYGLNANGNGSQIPFSLYVVGTWK